MNSEKNNFNQVIYFFSASSYFGGGERYATLMVKYLNKIGIKSYIISDYKNLYKECEISEESKINNNDILVFNGAGALYRYAKKYKNKKVYVHHTLLNDKQANLVKRILRPFLIKFYLDKNTIVIRVCKAALPDRFHSKLYTIHNGVENIESSNHARLTSKKFKLIMAGVLNENKNHNLAIHLLKHLPENVILNIYGNGVNLENLKKLSNDLEVDDRVNFNGHTDDILPIIQDSHLLLILSKNEAFPFIALEAMSVGIPVLSFKNGGIIELIEHNQDGFLCDYDESCVEVIQHIKRLMGDEKLRLNIANNGRKKQRSFFNIEKVVTNFLQALKENE